ncbi:MAG TPA: DUF1501 domain-containing protein [Pirellulaceae bacterium]|nr:DUF1501 domain-containing protein [Pirellulaceae bacterium]
MANHLPHRRRFLTSLTTLAGGLTLPQLLAWRASAKEAGTETHTAVIFLMLGGGPAQHETYDPKPDAPSEYRGPQQPIRSSVPGVWLCDLMPRQAAIMDKLCIVRSMQHREASHIALHMVESGYFLRNVANARRGEMPSVGSIVARCRSGGSADIPKYVSLPRAQAYSSASFIGAQYDAFNVDGDPNLPDFSLSNLAPAKGLTSDRLTQRHNLLSSLRRAQSFPDPQQVAEPIDHFAQQAVDLLLGSRAQAAFDLSREKESVRDAYGRSGVGQRLLLARRLVEADVPFVMVRTFDWDDHANLAAGMRQRCPAFDQAVATLVTDLCDRGLNQRVLVVAMGEFGRTPRVNANGGRDHWPGAGSVLFAGGRYRMGQVIGATDSKGGVVTEAPYGPQSVLHMVYAHLGIDSSQTFPDHTGRPRYILEEREPIREMIA